MFDSLGRFFGDSWLVRAFSADYDSSRLRHSYFVQLIEHALNRFPKFLAPPSELNSDFATVSAINTDSSPKILQSSAIVLGLANAMETPMPQPKFLECLKWFGAAFPTWGLLMVLIASPFLPTMILAGILVVVFGVALFRHHFELDLTAVMLLLFVAVTLFSGYTSLAPAFSIPIAVLTTVLMSSYLLVRTCFQGRKQIDFVLGAFVASAAVTALVGVYQIFIGYVNMTWTDQDLFAALQLRVYSTFANPNVYGTYLLLAIPVAAALVFYAKRPILKLCALGATGLLLIILLLTYSRGCYLALAFAVLVFVLLIDRRMIVLFVAGLVAMPFVLPASVMNRFLSIVNFADTSTVYRLAIYQGSLRILGDFWMAGIGQGEHAFNAVYPFYALSAATAAWHSHNLFMQVFLETGIVGFVLFMGMLAAFFRTQFSFMRKVTDLRHKIISAAMTAAVVGFLFQGIFDHAFYNYRVMLVFFMFMGIGNSFAACKEEGKI